MCKSQWLAKAAIESHHETWVGGECTRFKEIHDKGFRDGNGATRGTLVDLKVARSLAVKHRPEFFQKLEDVLTRGWEEKNLVEQADELKVFVNGWAAKGESRKNAASLAAKLTWFRKPTNWAFYDKLAADALRIPNGKPQERMLKYFKALEANEFVELCDQMRPYLQSHKKKMWPERVIDKVLWHVGASLRSEINLKDKAQKYDLTECIASDNGLQDCVTLLVESKLFKSLKSFSIP